MKRLVLVRHGESRWNAEARIQGQHCAGLSGVGHAQARVVAAALAARFPDATLVSSDLQRALETVSPIELELGRTAERDATVRERAFGAWEGRLRTDVAREDVPRWERWLRGEDVLTEIGGESAEQLTRRVVPAFERLLHGTAHGAVTIVVTHGGAIRHGLREWLRLPTGSLGGVRNASIAEVVAFDGARRGRAAGTRVTLDRWNEVGHLPVDLRT